MNTRPISQWYLAAIALIAAIAFAFTALTITEEHDITAGHLMMVAQFLLFAGSALGIDYQLSKLRG